MFESRLNKNKIGGYAGLDGNGKIDRLNLPQDIFVYSGAFSNRTITFQNTTGGTFTVTGITTPVWYAENSSIPNVLPIASGDNSIAFGNNATAIGNNMFICGAYAGYQATNANNSNFIGANAGYNAVDTSNAIFIGGDAGNSATISSQSVFIGQYSGKFANNSYQSNFIGVGAGQNASGTTFSNIIGNYAGNLATNCTRSNFIGSHAGENASNVQYSNFIGYNAGQNSTSDYVNAFGYEAHKGGSLNGQTVFANTSLPSFIDRAAATAAITILNGAVSGNTYMYYNETTFAIEGVRL